MKNTISILIVFLTPLLTLAQVGINTITPNASASLDVSSSNKGVLLPRVNLVDVSNNTTPINTPAISLLVYNTNPTVTNGNGEGYYFWNGIQWIKLFTSTDDKWTRNSSNQMFPTNLADNIGIGTMMPLAKLHVLNNDVVFSALGEGVYPAIQPSVIGAGRRFMWFSDKGACRLGYVDSTQWDDTFSPIGYYSFATGFNSNAAGDASIAMGYGSEAVGVASVALGYENFAAGENSFALGNNTEANGDYSLSGGVFSTALGESSIAIGNNVIASGNASTSIGISTRAIGDTSVAMGFNSEANGLTAVALGYENHANGGFSLAIGNNTEAQGYYSISGGLDTVSTGDASVALGTSTVASGNNSFAMGLQTGSIGEQSFALGLGSQSNGNHSLAGGNYTIATGLNSLAYGDHTTTTGENSVALGEGTNTVGKNSVAMGFSTSALGYNSVAMGENNDAQGRNSVATGENNVAQGRNSVVMGANTNAFGENSFALGDTTVANGLLSVAMGQSTTADGTNSFSQGISNLSQGFNSVTLGYSTISRAHSSIALGLLNDDTDSPNPNVSNPNDRIFQIGNGDPFVASRSNAVTVLRNGNVGIGTINPNSLLNVNGQITIDQKNFGGYGGLLIKGDSPVNNYPNICFSTRNTSNFDAISGYIGGRIISNTTGNETMDLSFYTSSSGISGLNEILTIKGTGNVGIGTINPSQKLTVMGNGLFSGTVTASCGTLICSDIRYKREIQPLNYALHKITNLNGYSYFWKTNEFPEKNFNDTKQIGFIAQEIEEVIPEIVYTDNDGYKTVDYSKVVPLLVEAIKEQQKMIEELKAEIEQIKK